MSQHRGRVSSLREKVDSLKKAIDLRDLFAERYPGRFRRSGRWLYGRSPYREDRHPSFAVNEDVFIDFATGESGDEVDFVQREEGVSFIEAVQSLEARAGGAFSLPSSARLSQFSPSPSEPPPAEWQDIMRAECRRARAYLFSAAPMAKQALGWLHERGLSSRTIRAAGLGFNPDWRRTRLRDSQTGQRVSIAPGILIPASVDGALWAVHIRTLPGIAVHKTSDGQELPKYLYARGSKTGALYNGDALYEGCDVLIVEGEFDALLAQQELGDRAVVVTLGSATNRLPKRWLDLLKLGQRVYSCLDSDEAGQRATASIGALLGDQHQPLLLPLGKDITEYVVDHGGNLCDWWESELRRTAPDPVQQPLPGLL